MKYRDVYYKYDHNDNIKIFISSLCLKECIREKGRNLIQSCDKNPYTHRTIQKATWQHKNATKNFDYTTIKRILNLEKMDGLIHVFCLISIFVDPVWSF